MKIAFHWPEDHRERVFQAIQNLPGETGRSVIRLKLFQGLPLPKIAERIGLDFNEVRKVYRSSLEQIARDFKDIADATGSPSAAPEGRPPSSVERKERVEKVSDLFWEGLHKGEELDREAIILQYPELGDALRSRLWLIELFYRSRPVDPPGHPPAPLPPPVPVQIPRPPRKSSPWRSAGDGRDTLAHPTAS